MATLYTSGILVRSISGKVGSLVVKKPFDYKTASGETQSATGYRLERPLTIRNVQRQEKFEKLAVSWREAHGDVGVLDKEYQKWRQDTQQNVANPFEDLFGGKHAHPVRDGTVRETPWKKPAAHVKKESYPPQTDPSKPWWTSPPTWKAECHAQRIADLTYQGFTDEIRLAWRRCCTPAYKTPYDVYQHQAIPRLVRGIPVSPVPPEQAGWKIRRLDQDLDYWHDQTPKECWAYPDASCQTWGLSMGCVRFAEHIWWDGFEWRSDFATLWSLYPNVGLGNERDKGFITCTIYDGVLYYGESKTFERLRWPEMEADPLHHDLQAHSASFLWEPAKRDYAGNVIEPRTPDTAKGITVKACLADWEWYHYRLPYPSKKCTWANMSEYRKEWPTGPFEWYVEYQ